MTNSCFSCFLFVIVDFTFRNDNRAGTSLVKQELVLESKAFRIMYSVRYSLGLQATVGKIPEYTEWQADVPESL